MFTNIHIFLTTWVLILILFHRYTYRYIDLLLLSFVTMFGGLYLSIINPQKYEYVLFYKKHVLSGPIRFVVDVLFHVLPFLFVCYFLPNSFDFRFVVALGLLFLYVWVVDVEKLYSIGKYEMLCVLLLSILVYILLLQF